MARREPRGLLDHERGRPQQQEERARRGPTGRHRVEREPRRLQRVRAGSPRTRRDARSSSRRRTRARPRARPARAARRRSAARRDRDADTAATKPIRRANGAESAVMRAVSRVIRSRCVASRIACGSFTRWCSVFGVAGVVGWDHWSFAFAVDECPAVVGLEVVVVSAERVDSSSRVCFVFTHLRGGRSRAVGCGCSPAGCTRVTATTTRLVGPR